MDVVFIAFFVWTLVALVVGMVIGRSIKLADERRPKPAPVVAEPSTREWSL